MSTRAGSMLRASASAFGGAPGAEDPWPGAITGADDAGGRVVAGGDDGVEAKLPRAAPTAAITIIASTTSSLVPLRRARPRPRAGSWTCSCGDGGSTCGPGSFPGGGAGSSLPTGTTTPALRPEPAHERVQGPEPLRTAVASG